MLLFFATLPVQMKGRVACEMGNQNELMVTEMVYIFICLDFDPNSP